jgi:hypothetical protein
MRLTLRTLLAYLDDILDPADKEQLAKKIESSEFAEDLVHRTRDTMRRLRLSAPQVIGSGMGLDPNTVAEYLDNVLPPESVGDFERICLESDMHLAEAAACHHVLTMVLGEPAEVDPIARQRMYSIPVESESRRRVRVEQAHVGVGTVPLAAAPVEMLAGAPTGVVTQAAATPEVPEYLRTSGWGGFRAALVGLAAVVLIAAGLFFVPGVREWIGSATTGSAELAGVASRDRAISDVTTTAPPSQTEMPAEPTDEAQSGGMMTEPDAAASAAPDRYDFPSATAEETPGSDSTSAPPLDSNVPPPNTAAPAETVEGTQGTQDNAAAPIPPQPSTELPASETNIASDPIATNVAIPPQPGDTLPPNEGTSPMALPVDPSAAGDVPSETMIAAADSGAADAGAPVEGNVPAAPALDETGQPVVVEEVPAGPVELGTYSGRKTVLLRRDENNGAWFRVEPRAAVMPGMRLLALPQYRPKILLASGVSLDVSGGTQLVMGTADESPASSLPVAALGEPLVEVVYGRIVLTNTAMDTTQLRLKLGGSVGEARLARNATLGVEVLRPYVPGHDPRQSSVPVVAQLFAPDGGVEWQDAAGQLAVNGSGRWTITEGVTSEVADEPSPPDWIDHEPVGQLSEQRYAAPKIETTLMSNRPVDIQLLEMFQTIEQREVKSLVAKCSIHVGVFQPFIEALRDSDQKPNWTAHIEALRAAMALSPESAQQVKQALDEQRSRPAADDLYEMLCGYSEEQVGRTADQVKTGAVARLVDWLEEDSLDYRVLAVHDLFEITGKRLMSDPAANQRERDQNVRRWRARLEDGEVMPVRR